MRGMGNMGNMQGMMQKMQKMQKEMEKTQKEIDETIFEASDVNQLLTVKVNGKKVITDIEIQEELVDPDDIDMLQDLLIATLNQAMAQVDQVTDERMGKFTKGLNLPF